MMVNITIIGTGYVGLVSGACLADFGNTVVCVDTDAAKIEKLKNGDIIIFEPGLDEVVERNVKTRRLTFTTELGSSLNNSDVIFIAVGTPPAEDGSADLQYVEQVARQIGRFITKYVIVVDKSTVPIGTGQKVKQWIGDELAKRGLDIEFDVVSNPEFLREGTAVYDFTHPDRVVIGAESEKARNIMKNVYRVLYLNETPYIETNIESAEMIKYASNAFLAVKISFINEIANLCEKTGANIKHVAKAIGKDGRIGSKFLHPGPGYGGSCFPKDTRAIAAIARENDSPLSIVETTISANDLQKLKMLDKIEQGMGGTGSLQNKTIAILGLAYKNNTSDMRESPAISICEGLVKRGARLRLWDPAAMQEAVWRLKSIEKSILFADNEYNAMEGSHALVLATEWNQFRNLDFIKVNELLLSPYFFDLRNIYNRDEVTAAGLCYFGVGT
jgi:UDPglucose 6-dehydrogenase